MNTHKLSINAGIVFALLAVLMLATRFSHVGSANLLPDASWAVFFAAGFYLRLWKWFVPFMALAVGIDVVATTAGGVSDYCMTVAYWFLLPTHAALWFGGRWLQKHLSLDTAGALTWAVTAVLSTSLAFLISNGSFYLLSGYATDLSLAGWWTNFSRYYVSFAAGTLFYIAAISVIHALLATIQTKRLTHNA